MTKRLLALAALCIATPIMAAPPVDGRWITAEKDAVITIADCGRTVCGRITKFLVPPPQGAEQRDVNNRNPELRGRKLLGMPVLSGFTEEEDLWRGEIYDPKTGKTYRSVIRRINATTLEVKGCVGPFCETQTWKRAR
ncbi:DUF2147 domain-containing protein [Qipengyuania gelatinilytica]|uniref:DUF2147 domain-containing protein n=1 Tax=Qipengyuania gelatinilytica TaxID=2867231 RepID=A0ABX8ZY36_9SPHN|nr:DUF2147 domain-containing protein [Qipengyuania gelatinilytica]QZD93895.1 DUF2147 domain-containing protein [Qipengyuania gelatinilytica]